MAMQTTSLIMIAPLSLPTKKITLVLFVVSKTVTRTSSLFPRIPPPTNCDAFMILGNSLLKTNPYDSVYYGLQDGTFASHYYSRKAAFREKGESENVVPPSWDVSAGFSASPDGAAVVGIDGDENQYYKSYISCVDKTNGSPTPCLLGEDDSYISCLDDGCTKLEKCQDTESQRDCDALFGSSDAERLECLSKIKYCTLYAIEKTPSASAINDSKNEDEVRRGYIPRVIYCVDMYGIPTQIPGTNSVPGDR